MTAHHKCQPDATSLQVMAGRLYQKAREIESGVQRPDASLPMRTVLLETCSATQANPDAIRGPCRKQNLFRVRAEAMRRMHDEHGYSLPQIGRFFSGRDHTSVLYAVRRARVWRALEAENEN